MADTSPAAPPRPWLKNYNPGVAHDLDLPETSLVHVFEESARRAGTRSALEFFGARTTYAQLAEQVSRVAEGLRVMGVQPGDRVALSGAGGGYSPDPAAAFHLLISSLGGNIVVTTILDSLRQATVGYVQEGVLRLDDWPGVRRRLQVQHRRILAAVERARPEEAAAAVAEHISWFHATAWPTPA